MVILTKLILLIQEHSISLHLFVSSLISFISVLLFSGYLSFAGSCDGAQSTAERSYPTSKVRGRSWENPMPEGQQPRGVTLRLRSGAVAKSARLRQRRSSLEELPTA